MWSYCWDSEYVILGDSSESKAAAEPWGACQIIGLEKAIWNSFV